MTSTTALLFGVPLAVAAVDAVFGQAVPGAVNSVKDITLVGVLAAAVVALWQDRSREEANRDKDRDAMTKLVGDLSTHIVSSNAHIASSTEVQRNTAKEIAELGEIIRQSSETRQHLVDALRQLKQEPAPSRRRGTPTK